MPEATTLAIGTDKHISRTLSIIDEFFGDVEPKWFAFRLWDGTTWGAEPDDAQFTVVLKHPGALRRMFLPLDDLTLGEAYIYDDFDIEGDICAVGELGERMMSATNGSLTLARCATSLRGLPAFSPEREGRQGARLRGKAHSKQRDQAAIRYHYDVSNDFYELWLDRNMVYSCAYFGSPGEDLDTAQERKLDYICRKLRLTPGDRLLDIGCGWGGLVMHAAREYGARVTGVTLSRNQAALANQRIEEAGLAQCCRVEVLDYRDADESTPFDKLVSVGMFEHVGSKLLPTYFEKAFRLLRPGGVFLNHGISSSIADRKRQEPTFRDVYVFPDGELVPVSVTLAEAERAGFDVRDTENLREHYAMTLRQWVRRLEENAEQAVAASDEVTYRVWRLFMSYSAHLFERGTIGVHQSLLLKPDGGRSRLPLTRDDWYRQPNEA